jgi:co-chaperonin GroES (HSP10)
MKKTLIIVALVAVVSMFTLGGSVNATTQSTLADELYAKLSAYGVTAADKVKVERYLADNTITDDEANAIIAKADEVVAIMNEEGVTDVTKLSEEAKSQVKAVAQEAASVAGLSLTFSEGKVDVYDASGNLVDSITTDSIGKLAYTGNSANTILVVSSLVVSSVAVIALAAMFVTKKSLSKVGA